MSKKKAAKKKVAKPVALPQPAAPAVPSPQATAMLEGVKGINGHIFADVRPSADIVLNTDVAKTADTQVVQPLPQPRPAPANTLEMELADVISADALDAITKSNQMVFHTVGDTGGVHNPQAELSVADRMEQDFGLEEADRPSFFLHLGDVVYFDGEQDDYYPQYYYPYRHYNAPIFAIPGNHDGDMPNGKASPQSLAAFVRNFCAPTPVKRPEAKETLRTAMTQPYVYFQLNTPLATFVNLYTNCPGSGHVDAQQAEWLASALQKAPADKALILSLHHPVFSEDGDHGSNASMLKLIDDAVGNGRHPDMVLTGHVHNYQRFTRTLDNGREVPYIVAGCGGYYDLYPVGIYAFKQKTPTPVYKNLTRTNPARTLVNYVDNYFGYLRITVTEFKIRGVFQPSCPGKGITRYRPLDTLNLSTTEPMDPFTVDLKSHQVTNG